MSENGRFVPKEVAGAERTWPATLVLLALGFLGPERGGILDQLGVTLDARGNVETGPDKQTKAKGLRRRRHRVRAGAARRPRPPRPALGLARVPRESPQPAARPQGTAYRFSGALARLAPTLAAATRGAGKSMRERRKLKLSPERRAALEQQGQYMGYLRNLKPRQKAHVKALRSPRGVRAAIASAKSLARMG